MNRFKGILPLLVLAALLALPVPAGASPAGSTLLVSRPDGTGLLGALIDGSSPGPLAVSDEGRYVAFVSEADGFAQGADPGALNLFVRDTVASTTTLASRSDGATGAGANEDVEISKPAKIGITVQPGSQVLDAPHDRPHVLVVFSTRATNLVNHASRAVPPTGAREAVWMRDVTAGTTYLVSRASTPAGAPADGPSMEPSISAGPRGPLVAFSSESTNLDRAGPTSPTRSVYLREMTEGVTHPVSCLPDRCAVPSGVSLEPSLRVVKTAAEVGLCPRGQQCALVAFRTEDPEIAGQGAGSSNAQIAVATAIEKADGSGLAEFDGFHIGSTVNLRPTTLGNRSSLAPVLSEDGLGVAFVSEATNLDPFGPPLPPGETTQAYVHTFGSNATGLVSVGKAPTGNSIAANGGVRGREISIGGPIGSWRFGFHTAATNLGIPDPGVNRAYQVRPVAEAPSPLDRAAGAAGVLGNGESSGVVLSGDGTTAVFRTSSTNLNAGGGEDFERVYVRRIDSGAPDFNSLRLVSRPSGTAAFSPGLKRASIPQSAISADGRYVAFESTADDLSNLDDDRFTSVFVRDTVNGTTTLVSRANGAGGAAADQDSKLNGISENGQRILFTTSAGNLGPNVPGFPHAFVRDVAAQTTTVVSRANGSTGTITSAEGLAISGNGNRVAFIAQRPLDPEADNNVRHLYVRDLAAQTTTFADRENGIAGPPAKAEAEEAALNRDGSRVAWTTRASLIPDVQLSNTRKIFVRDLAGNTTVLASRADGATGAAADSDSFTPALNAAGDVVAFGSVATNLGPTSRRAIWVRRLAAGRTELVSRASGAAGAPANDFSSVPSIDATGTRIAFASGAGNLRPNPTENAPLAPHAYVRDTSAKTTELVDRVSGIGGAPADPARTAQVSISASGDCVAFAGTGANFADDLAGGDFAVVRERVLRGSCGPSSVPAIGVAAPALRLPVLSRLRMRPTRFHVGGRGGGTRISFELSEPSRVTLAFKRVVADRSGGLALRRVGRLNLKGRAGANTVRFSGRLKGRPLQPGRYEWTATPLQGRARSGHFVVVKSPQR